MTFTNDELEAGFTAILAVWIRDYCDANGGEDVHISRRGETKLLYETGDTKMEISVRCVTQEIENEQKAESLRKLFGTNTSG